MLDVDGRCIKKSDSERTNYRQRRKKHKIMVANCVVSCDGWLCDVLESEAFDVEVTRTKSYPSYCRLRMVRRQNSTGVYILGGFVCTVRIHSCREAMKADEYHAKESRRNPKRVTVHISVCSIPIQ
jgi:hypothetical protein